MTAPIVHRIKKCLARSEAVNRNKHYAERGKETIPKAMTTMNASGTAIRRNRANLTILPQESRATAIENILSDG